MDISEFVKNKIKMQPLRDYSEINYSNDKFEYSIREKNRVTGLRVMTNRRFKILDLDCKNNPKEGREIMKHLFKHFSWIRETWIEVTKSRGYHVLFIVEEETEKNSIGKTVYDLSGWIYGPFNKIEIELFEGLPVTVALSQFEDGRITYKCNDKPIKTISIEDYYNLKELLEDLQYRIYSEAPEL